MRIISSLPLSEPYPHLFEHSFKYTMKISLYLSVLLLALVIKIVTANVRIQRSTYQFCGSKLAEIMKIVCQGKYNSQEKRSLIDSDVWDNKDVEDYNAIDYPYAYQPKQEAMSFLPLRLLRSPKGRIIDECCNKPCLLSELRSYCAI